MKNRRAFAVGGSIVAAGAGALFYSWLFGDYRVMKSNPPPDDATPSNPNPTPPPGHTGRKLVDALLPKLQAISSSTGIPLGLMVGWIICESGGKLGSTTDLDERGYYQLMPAESARFGLDHKRLSTDSDYSLNAGTPMIQAYMAQADALNAWPKGSPAYWILVKMIHTVGAGQTKKWITAAQKAGKMGSWSEFTNFITGQHWTGPQPKKWLPFLAASTYVNGRGDVNDSIYKVGKPFGFGSDGTGPLIAGSKRKHRDRRTMLGLDVLGAS